MQKFFVPRAVSVLSVLISLAALIFSLWRFIEEEFAFEDLRVDIFFISLFLFGLLSLSQKVKFLNHLINKNVRLYILVFLNLIIFSLSIIFSIEEEDILIFAIFALSWIVTFHFHYSGKIPMIEDFEDKKNIQIGKILIWLKTIDYYRIFIIAAIMIYLIIFHEKSKNGRYISFDNDHLKIDTRTGEVYTIRSEDNSYQSWD